ncbi:hypothetical protein BHM03_00060331, partial [Ensete ventricosum]
GRKRDHGSIVPTAVSARMYHAPLGFPLASFQSARAMERGADVVASRGRCNSAAAPHRTTRPTALGRRFISPLLFLLILLLA